MNSPYNHRGYPNASFHELLLTIAFDNVNVSLTCWRPSLALKSREFTAQYENDVLLFSCPSLLWAIRGHAFTRILFTLRELGMKFTGIMSTELQWFKFHIT